MDSPRARSELSPDYGRDHRSYGSDSFASPGVLLRKLFAARPLFILTVLLPTLGAILYYGLFASDVYISESRYVVRSPEKNTATSGLGLLLKSTGFTNDGDEIYAAEDYVLSRNALQALNRGNAFAKAYHGPAISMFDRFNALGLGGTFEDLYKYYRKRVTVEHNTSSSIAKLTVRAYTPQDAHRFNEKLLEMAEATVNRLNTRGRQDLIRFAQTEVDEAERKDREAAVALSGFRNQQGVVDPEKQANVQLQMISKLQDDLIATKTQLSELRAFAPQNPQIEVLVTRAGALGAEIERQIGEVAGNRGSLSSRAAQFQRLTLESQFADKQLASAMAGLDDARNEARRKQAYVERIVEPNLPDDALEPQRLRGIFSTFVLGLAAWGVLSMLIAGVLEHHD